MDMEDVTVASIAVAADTPTRFLQKIKKSKSKRKEHKSKSSERIEKSDGNRKRKRKTSDGISGRSHKRLGYYHDSSKEPEGINPVAVVREMLQAYPSMAGDMRHLLQILDGGQAVDIRGMPEKSLTKYLKKLFVSLNLKENANGGVFLLPSNTTPTLEVVGHVISFHIDDTLPLDDVNAELPKVDSIPVIDDTSSLEMPSIKDGTSAPKRRPIGPEMPSAELLAAAAKLTEAQAELRESELDDEDEFYIGPPPPIVVSEAASANEAECFEEVTRIMEIVDATLYEILSVNHKMSVDNVKKRYWKLSLMVHPDKCAHPQAHQAFIILNKAFKDFQDPDKRKAIDDKIKAMEEEEAFKVELKSRREAAHWRRLQGISMEGDDKLLAESNNGVERKRDEWMTSLPPERRGLPTQATMFSKNTKEGFGRRDTCKNETAALASNEEEKKRTSSDADLVDQYNKIKRSKSLVQKQQEEALSQSKRQSNKKKGEKEEWIGQHPWKPWDREKDLTAGRQNVKLDSEKNISEGLSSRFSSANFLRNFL